MKKHILFISRGMSYGGSGRNISVFSKGLIDEGYPVSLLILRDYPTEYEIDPRVHVVRIHLKSEKIKIGFLDVITKWFPAIKRCIGELRPDLVIPFGVDVCILAILGNGKRSRVCATVRSDPRHEPKNGLFRMIRDVVYRRADYIWVQNTQQIQRMNRSISKSKYIVVPNPVGAEWKERKYSYADTIEHFVNLGRLCEGKNQKTLIDAFGILCKKYPHITLDIYGEGELRERLQKQIEQLQLKDRVFLRGRTEEVPAVLAKADAYVLSSNLEGMPNGLMEAMALGMPCISTDCNTGPRDFITDRENGLLVPCNDAAMLAEAMETYIRDPELAKRLGRRARTVIWEKFDENVVVKKFAEIIERM